MKRNGFSLLELIIVIAILGILAAILLPVLTETRGGAGHNRTHCMNNLRQIALGTLNYESANMHFPAAKGLSKFSGVGAADEYSAFVEILPFLEQNELYQAITKGQQFEGVQLSPCPPLYDDLPCWQQELYGCYHCPSVPRREDADQVSTHYGFCIGDRARNIADPKSLRGGFASSKPIGFGEITDGSSNTILAGEICSSSDEDKNPFAINQSEAFLNEPESCIDLTKGKYGDWTFNKGVPLSPYRTRRALG